ncbi:MAG: hypothetical protein HC898_09800 [Phycisphaerales bacterium]|nr:hypothetical protein [Phycisphaerales bacterium]
MIEYKSNPYFLCLLVENLALEVTHENKPWLAMVIKQSLLAVVFVGLGILMLAWLMGAFSPKVSMAPGNATSATSANATTASHGDIREMSKVDLIEVRKVALPIVESAVGAYNRCMGRRWHQTSSPR